MTVHDSASRGFARGAAAYERGRPDYPDDAVSWLAAQLALAPGRVVADVGAGTGKLTRALQPSGAQIIAIEPVGAMRELLQLVTPAVSALDATAEDLPLGDASIDAIVAGQAFHWFDGPRALAEFHRVIRRGGRLGLIWNRRCEEQPLQRGIEEIIAPHRGSTPSHKSGEWRRALDEPPALFEQVDQLALRFEQRLDREAVVDRVLSTSFIGALPDKEQARVLEQVRALVQREPPALAYLTEVSIFRRLDAG